jgi:hypothetical protein
VRRLFARYRAHPHQAVRRPQRIDNDSGRERYGTRSRERAGELREDRQVGVESNAIQSTGA